MVGFARFLWWLGFRLLVLAFGVGAIILVIEWTLPRPAPTTDKASLFAPTQAASPFDDDIRARTLAELHATITIPELHAALMRQEFTCYEFVYAAFLRIAALDLNTESAAPINAFTYLDPGALDQARMRDTDFEATGVLSGPLHCVTVVPKDNFAVAGLPLYGGSRALIGTMATQNAWVVEKMTQAGGIVIGLGAMDELGGGISGISGLSGRTGNPFNPALSNGGSSSGPAAAVAAGFGMVGLGTDNCGSLTIPATYAGLHTIRTTLGLINQDGVIPANLGDQVAGPITRSADDLGRVMAVLNPPITLDETMPRFEISVLRGFGGEARQKPTFLPELKTAMAEAKIAVGVDSAAVHDGIAWATDRVIKGFIPERYYVGQASALDQFFEDYTDADQSLTKLCAADETSGFRRRSFSRCMIATLRANMTRAPGSPYDQERLNAFAANAELIGAAIGTADALLLPAEAKGIAQINETQARPNCALLSASGAPAVTVFAGTVESDGKDLPLGLMLVGKPGTDAQLLQGARLWSENMPDWRPPALPLDDLAPALPADWFAEDLRIRREMGRIVFEKVLADGSKTDVTPDVSKAALEQAKALINP